MDEVIGGTVAPDSLSVSEAQFCSQRVLDELHKGQSHTRRRRENESHRAPTFVTDSVVVAGIVGLCLLHPAVKSFQY